jgi:FIMAH domain
VKRATIALGIVAIVAGSCGGGELSTRLATSLENRVASIRGYAESGRPGLARSALRNLVELVTAQTEAGRIDEGRAAEILAAAQAVAEQLTLLPRTAPTESPSPSPSLEGNDEDGHGNGDGKDKGKGNGDEDHGNDD